MTTFSAWSLSLVEREESLKISLYFALACVRGAPSLRHLAVPIIYAVTEEEPARYSTPLSRSVGARIPNRSIPPALKNLVGTVVGAALRAGMLQEPAVARSGRNPVQDYRLPTSPVVLLLLFVFVCDSFYLYLPVAKFLNICQWLNFIYLSVTINILSILHLVYH